MENTYKFLRRIYIITCIYFGTINLGICFAILFSYTAPGEKVIISVRLILLAVVLFGFGLSLIAGIIGRWLLAFVVSFPTAIYIFTRFVSLINNFTFTKTKFLLLHGGSFIIPVLAIILLIVKKSLSRKQLEQAVRLQKEQRRRQELAEQSTKK